ncbi:class I SAM-dependent methyltransferase [Sulfitobacter sp. JB4-11]|uniref:class I SAM-dependent methyltransferase n=1 Tax=Sulfitobacter rhodophyticola TaxID=3238304 RepID=UPI003510F820
MADAKVDDQNTGQTGAGAGGGRPGSLPRFAQQGQTGTNRFGGGQQAPRFTPAPRWAGRADTNPEAEMEYNDRIRRFYAMHLAHEGESEIFRGTEFWNWGYWTQSTSSQNEACENLLELLLSFIPEKSGRILDVACGKGATTRHLLRYFAPENVTGINISPEQIAACKERLPEVNFQEMDAADLEFGDGEIDNIICVEAMCHFNTRADFLREALRVLKPGGYLVFSDSLLRAETEIQPRVNYLETALQYTDVGLEAGFDTVEVYDTTEETWNRFGQFHMRNAYQRVQSGELTPRNLGLTGMWLRRTAPVAYVVGWMQKSANS